MAENGDAIPLASTFCIFQCKYARKYDFCLGDHSITTPALNLPGCGDLFF